MRMTTISKGGQVSIPAEVRHRWRTSRVVLEDQGAAVLIRPIPPDPIGAAIGSLSGRAPASDQLRSLIREEESAIDTRRTARP
jgi:bifunctional DNA-binding transcriptional regulator/antitoxin component of YhaV-PrlF toxin-antitoxin module